MATGTLRKTKEGEYRVGVTVKTERQHNICYAGLYFLVLSHTKDALRFLRVEIN